MSVSVTGRICISDDDAGVIIMLSLTGSPLPFQLNHDYYMYEEAYWRNPVGIDALNHSWGLYLFNMTFGSVGVFVLYPILFVGVFAISTQIFANNLANRVWNIGLACAMLILGAYYVSNTNNYGGASFGFRWLIITTPFLVVSATCLIHRFRSRILTGICSVLITISIYSAMLCRLNPWSLDQEWTTRIFGTLL